MKSLKLFSIIFFFCMLCSASCNKDKDPLTELPSETQTGANTFGCLLDGIAWTPKGSDGYSGQNKKAYYQYIYPSPVGYVFRISATNFDNEPLLSFGLGVDSLKVKQDIAYKIRNGHKGEFSASYRIGSSGEGVYWVGENLDGEIFFTKFDETNQIASGTFWFDAMNASGKIIHVTKGRFDMKFTR